MSEPEKDDLQDFEWDLSAPEEPESQVAPPAEMAGEEAETEEAADCDDEWFP